MYVCVIVAWSGQEEVVVQHELPRQHRAAPAASTHLPTQGPPPPDVALDRSRIYIGNLPHTVTEDDVRELVEPYGAVRDVFVNSQKGFAFVKMDSPQSAEAVVTNLDMNLRRGRRLRVTPASNAKGKLAKALGQGGGAVRPRDEKPGGRCRLFVGNLPASTGEEELRRLFSEHGEVQETFLNSEKGFGFVKMASYEAAEAAKAALDDALVDGRRIQMTGGRSVGEGIVEFARKPAAQAALKRCLEGCFLLTSEPRPVYAEPLEYRDWVLGLPERTVSRRGRGYARERELGPRFARPGTQEHRVAERWKRFLDFEKDKREELEKVLNEERRKLEEEVERFRREQVLERPFPPWQDGPHDQYASYLGYDTGYLGYPPQYGAGWNHRSPY
ncbi:hypothetical protein MTO96_025747 [Rhipicephalus appendiculatus]